MPGYLWAISVKVLLMLMPCGISQRSTKFHTEKCLKNGIFHPNLKFSVLAIILVEKLRYEDETFV